jgi:hypothetical protein
MKTNVELTNYTIKQDLFPSPTEIYPESTKNINVMTLIVKTWSDVPKGCL